MRPIVSAASCWKSMSTYPLRNVSECWMSSRAERQVMEKTAPSPFISVIIPTFNRAELLRSALESLASQSVPNHLYEIVVIDDGSSDATNEVCQAFCLRAKLKYWRIDNSGISAAKN